MKLTTYFKTASFSSQISFLALLAIFLTCLLSVGCSDRDVHDWRKRMDENQITNKTYNENDFSVICLRGVQYWIRGAGYNSYMTAKINSKTLLPETCNNEKDYE